MKKSERIFIKEWLSLKPYNRETAADRYYLGLINKVKEALLEKSGNTPLQRYFEPEEINLLSYMLTGYLEDVVSEVGLWKTFVKLHLRFYGKPVPFYDTSNYYEDEINQADVFFLIWYHLNTVQVEFVVAPNADWIIQLGEAVMEVLEDAWEDAPENDQLKAHFTLPETETDFYSARQFIDKVLFSSFLMAPDTLLAFQEQQLELIQDPMFDRYGMSLLSETRDAILQMNKTKLLALRGNVWAAELLGEDHPLYALLLEMSPKVMGLFLYLGQDEQHLHLEHIASEKKFALTKKSLDHAYDFVEQDTILLIGMVRWMSEWWFSGTLTELEYSANMVLDEKNSIEKRQEVAFLDDNEEVIQDQLYNQQQVFKKMNGGKPIAFMDSSEVNGFIKDFLGNYNESLGLSKEAKKAAEKRAKEKGFLDRSNDQNSLEAGKETIVFFNPKTGLEIVGDGCSAFPDPSNPYYQESEEMMDLAHVIMAPNISPELTRFCIEEYHQDHAYFSEGEGRSYLENLDFVLRYWKNDIYQNRPRISTL